MPRISIKVEWLSVHGERKSSKPPFLLSSLKTRADLKLHILAFIFFGGGLRTKAKCAVDEAADRQGPEHADNARRSCGTLFDGARQKVDFVKV